MPTQPTATRRRTIHVPRTPLTVGKHICPICGMVEHLQVTAESLERNVAEDRWALTPLGQALLDGLRALEQGGKPDA
jgi:hypothetical protein